ncbi:M56 family metallopeptidase [Algoriphagus confluentis]|uniref:Peptidase M56 domain-containing protein n=1 Tax=Algoriphagus confluentis TaxID=1697556 RepID=A0ABQ6PLQ4_9BACT|nr:hypothetical protein Aconfl_07460 [Algoriphagus confluentis]
MNLLNDWISEPLLNALGWTLVHSVWQLILIAGLLALVLRLAKSSTPALKYGLAVAALMVSFFSVGLTFVYEWSQVEAAASISLPEDFTLKVYQEQVGEEISLESWMTQTSFWIETNLTWLVNFWFLGALLFVFRLANSLSEIRSLRKQSTVLLDFETQQVAQRIAKKLGIQRKFELRTHHKAQSPLTFGTLKPVILLPAALVFHLTPHQLEAILAHEFAHVKRNDYLVHLLLSGLEVIFFFHPCYWWMSQTVKELRENAADDLALKSGIQPKVLATSLAEVINFTRENTPELSLTAGKKRNPTLLRIKRILGYSTENYPQTPLISIPMLLTAFLSLGLMASAQQDTPKSPEAPQLASEELPLSSSFVPITPQDTTIKTYIDRKTQETIEVYGKNTMIITSDDGKVYQVNGDRLIYEGDTLPLSPKTKAALEKLKNLETSSIPDLDFPPAPEFPMELEMVPMPDFEVNIPGFEEIPPFPMEAMAMPPFPDFPMAFEFQSAFAGAWAGGDTTKMTPQEREKLQKEMAFRAKEFSREAELRAKDWEQKWKENEQERQAKMAEWEARFKEEFEPRIKDFELRMKEWQAANEPKMKEFEAKMKAWQEAQEPKLKEFESRMKEWEKAQKPKLEEFQKKMEIWQKEHKAKMEEFQMLLKEELQKAKENN